MARIVPRSLLLNLYRTSRFVVIQVREDGCLPKTVSGVVTDVFESFDWITVNIGSVEPWTMGRERVRVGHIEKVATAQGRSVWQR